MEVVRIVSFCGDACCIINIPSTLKTRLVYFSGLESVTLYENELWAKWSGISKTAADRLSQPIIGHHEATDYLWIRDNQRISCEATDYLWIKV